MKPNKSQDAKPKTGVAADSNLTTMLKRLSKSGKMEKVPSLPPPVFDQYMGKQFSKKRQPD